MSNVPPLLSVVMVVGSARSQAQSVVDALYAQTRPDDMEIVIVDIAAVGTLPLRTEPTVYTKYILQPGVEFWGKARTEGVQHASAAVVAFLEDHCWPEPDWADALIEAHQQPWASVGYAVKNGSPDTYLYRAALLADYGLWAHPARGGPTKLLPGNNVSYKRDLLLSFGEQLSRLIMVDFTIQELILQRGLSACIEPRARVAHKCFARLSELWLANYYYARVMAVTRIEGQQWGRLRRLVYGVGAPLGVPILRLIRLLRSLRGRRPLWLGVFMSLPVIWIIYYAAAMGEGFGYLLGPGIAEQRITHWEVHAPRV